MNKNDKENSAQKQKPRRRWYQFSLRTFLLVTTIGAAVFALWIYPAARQNRAAVRIEASGGYWYFEKNEPPRASQFDDNRAYGYQHFFRTIKEVNYFSGTQPDEVDWSALPQLEKLIFTGNFPTDDLLASLSPLKNLSHSNSDNCPSLTRDLRRFQCCQN